MSVRRATIVLIHGANGSGATMKPLADGLDPHVGVFAPNLLGQGGRPPQEITVENMVADLIEQLDAANISRSFIFGYSSGGILALYIARHFPERVIGVSALAPKYIFDRRTVSHWTYLANPERVKTVPNRAQELAETHQPQNWEDVVNNTRRFFESLGRKPPLSEADLREIRAPSLLFASNQDQVVPFAESVALGKLIPNARTVIFSGQCHPLHVVPFAAIAVAIRNWIDEVQAGVASTNA